MQKSFPIIVLVLLFASLSFPNYAYSVEDDLGLWTPVWITQPINNKFSTLLEISPRFQGNITYFNQLFIRPAIEYKFSKNLSFWQGYSWNPRFHPNYKREQRIWQQLLLEKEFKKYTLQNRLRLEEHFMQDVSGVPIKLRYRTGASIPLDKKKLWRLVLWDEIWLNLGNHFNGPQSGFDRNWIFTGINKRITDNVSLEAGYQLEYINRTSPTQDLLNHVIVINTYFFLPQFRKSK